MNSKYSKIHKFNWKKIVWLSVLYSIVLFSILLAFPKKLYDSNSQDTFSSAPRDTWPSSLPITIITTPRGTQRTWNTTPSTNTITATPTNTIDASKISTTLQKITIQPQKNRVSCADAGICNKIHILDWYTNTQKSNYYTALLRVVTPLHNLLPANPTSLWQTLYSLTLKPTAQWDDRRGLGWTKTIQITTQNIRNTQEFREVLTHEIAHVFDLWMLVWKNSTKNTDFLINNVSYSTIDDPSLDFYKISRKNSTTRHPTSSYLDFVSGYGMTSPYEDFSESFNMYLWHNSAFKLWTQNSPILLQKYNYMHNIFKWSVLGDITPTWLSDEKSASWRPWDTTRMSLE